MTTELKPPPMSDEQIGAIYSPWADCAGASIADLMRATLAARDAQWLSLVGELQRDATAAIGLLARMRAACGDNGVRMQDELEQHLRELVRDAARLDALQACNAGRNMWIVARGKDSFTVALKSPYGNCITRKTLRAAIDAALSSEGKGAEG